LTVANSGENDFGGNPIQLDGTLTVNQSVDSTIDGMLTGSGTLIKAGSGTLTLAGDNSGLSSVVQINGGTVRAAVPNSLGLAGVTIASGAKLNVSGQNLAALPVVAGGAGPDGAGAIVNNGAAQEFALGNVTLTANTAFGGSGPWSTDPVQNSGRMDINGNTLSTGNQPYTLTKVGLNQVTLRDCTVDTALGNIDVQAGLLALQGGTSSLGNPNSTLTVQPGASVSFFDTATPWDKKFVLVGNGTTASLINYNGNNTIMGPVMLDGNCVVSSVPADRGLPVSLTLLGPLGGTGALIKSGHDTTALGATNTYTGATIVTSGTLSLTGEGRIATTPSITLAAGAILDASTRNDATFALATGQMLQGNGTVNGTFVASTGSAVSPGASVGALTFNSAVTLSGTVRMELDGLNGTNDVIASLASIALNSAVVSVTNIAGVLNDGAQFKLFDAPAGQLSGTFTIQPATPGPGQTWNTSTLAADGILKVVGSPSTPGPRPRIVSVTLSGSNLVISGTNGTPSGNYYVLAGTNVTQPLTTWERIATNPFSSGNFSFTNTMNPNLPQRYFLLQLP
jgi:autotransporter-associated beta strand protein